MMLKARFKKLSANLAAAFPLYNVAREMPILTSQGAENDQVVPSTGLGNMGSYKEFERHHGSDRAREHSGIGYDLP